MNWKEHPHLFANGLFDIKYSESSPMPLNYVTLMRLGKKAHLNNCTLIARPIADMTDEELYQVWGNERQTAYEIRKTLIYQAEAWTLKATSLLGMIGMGVYPFDQSHFDDGTVIKAE